VPPLRDLLLAPPLPVQVMHGLLFGLFVAHLLFVLLAVGTAILAIAALLGSLIGKRPRRAEARSWSDRALRTFMAHKSLAVVLGVGPLLLIQSGLTLPFFTAVNLLAPWWLLIIGLLIVAFLSLDGLGQHPGAHPALQAGLGLLGLFTLLAVPAIFAATLITTENPSHWVAIARNGYTLPRALAWHWLLRYLHVLGAAVVFAGVFHYLIARRDAPARKTALYRWVAIGMAFQVLVGVPLYMSMPIRPNVTTNAVFVGGVAAVAAMLATLLLRRSIDGRVAPAFLGAILILMLLTRQFTQYRGTDALQRESARAAAGYRAKLTPYTEPALAAYRRDLEHVPRTGEEVYGASCAFCHGAGARGDGVEARGLQVPPEELSAIRTTRAHLNQILLDGIPSTAMPRFAYLNWKGVDEVSGYLDARYHVLGKLPRVTVPVSASASEQAGRIWLDTCAQCHGMNATGDTPRSREMHPPPPDFTLYTVTGERAFRVISRGYPGTAMPSFAAFPEEVRWGLVNVVHNFYDPTALQGEDEAGTRRR
jgi:mono/diheme cytochrome c family protein